MLCLHFNVITFNFYSFNMSYNFLLFCCFNFVLINVHGTSCFYAYICPTGLGTCLACRTYAVQTFLWSLKLVIRKHHRNNNRIFSVSHTCAENHVKKSFINEKQTDVTVFFNVVSHFLICFKFYKNTNNIT